MSDESRYLDSQDRPQLDPHEVAATLADNQRMAEEGEPRPKPYEMIRTNTPWRNHLMVNPSPPETLKESASRLVRVALECKDQRDLARRKLNLILEHLADFDKPMFTEKNSHLQLLIKYVRMAAQEGLG